MFSDLPEPQNMAFSEVQGLKVMSILWLVTHQSHMWLLHMKHAVCTCAALQSLGNNSMSHRVSTITKVGKVGYVPHAQKQQGSKIPHSGHPPQLETFVKRRPTWTRLSGAPPPNLPQVTHARMSEELTQCHTARGGAAPDLWAQCSHSNLLINRPTKCHLSHPPLLRLSSSECRQLASRKSIVMALAVAARGAGRGK